MKTCKDSIINATYLGEDKDLTKSELEYKNFLSYTRNSAHSWKDVAGKSPDGATFHYVYCVSKTIPCKLEVGKRYVIQASFRSSNLSKIKVLGLLK